VPSAPDHEWSGHPANCQIAGRNCDDLAVHTIEAAGVTNVADAWQPQDGITANSSLADLFGLFQSNCPENQ